MYTLENLVIFLIVVGVVGVVCELAFAIWDLENDR